MTSVRLLLEHVRFLRALAAKLLPLALGPRDRALVAVACGVLALSRCCRRAWCDCGCATADASCTGTWPTSPSSKRSPKSSATRATRSRPSSRCARSSTSEVTWGARSCTSAAASRKRGSSVSRPIRRPLRGSRPTSASCPASSWSTPRSARATEVARFYPSRSTWGSTGRADMGAGTAIDVAQRSLDSLLGERSIEHVDLLKIDIEGMEYETLAAWRGLPTRVSAIFGEFHTFIPAVAPQERAFFALLERFDVERERGGQLFRAYRR